MPRNRSINLVVAILLLCGCRSRLYDATELDGCGTAAPWPMQGHDPRHRSQSCHLGPEGAHLRFRTERFPGGISSLVIAADGTLYSMSGNEKTGGALIAFSPDGVERNRIPATSGASLAIARDGSVVIAETNIEQGFVRALDPTLNTEKWRVPCRGADPLVTPSDDGRIYVNCSLDRGLLSLDARGVSTWSPAGDRTDLALQATTTDGSLFAIRTGDVASINPQTGNPHFTVTPQVPNPHLGEIGPDGAFDFIASDGNLSYLESHDPIDGHLLSLTQLDEEPLRAAAVGPHGQRYIADGKHILAIGPEGKLAWAYAPEASDDHFTIPLVAVDGSIYVLGYRESSPNHPRSLILISFSESGTERWATRFEDTEDQLPTSLALATDGTLYAAGTLRLYAIDRAPTNGD